MITDTQAMDRITEAMSAKEWSADTLDAIAEYVTATGRIILDPAEDPDDATIGAVR